MSTAKRAHQRPYEAGSAAASQPPSKKAKISSDSHVATFGLEFLTDERKRSSTKLKAETSDGKIQESRRQPNDAKASIIATPDASNDVDMDDASSSGEKDDDNVSSVVSDSSEGDVTEAATGGARDGEEEPATLTNGVAEHDDESEEEDQPANNGARNGQQLTKRPDDVDDVEVETMADDAGPSFGDMLLAAHPQTIDVQSAFADRNPDAKALAQQDQARSLQAPSATSLGTVLTQALRTNDRDLLESCLQTRDQASIRSTIQRLQSPLVSTLLKRLAERLHKRPGRAGPLMVWVQWSLVVHGGYLASRPDVMNKLASLHQVVRERANSLQSLMTLKGKLDMLSAQIELRRSMQASKAARDEIDDEGADVIYVEGERDESSEEEEEASDASEGLEVQRKPRSSRKRGARNAADALDDSMGDTDGNIIQVNGIEDGSIDGSDNEDEEGDMPGFIDDEAEESSADEDAETSAEEDDDLDEEDEDDDEDISVSEDEVPPAAKPKSRAASARRR